MILFLCDDSKYLFGLSFITKNTIESLFDTVELRLIVAFLPICHSCAAKSVKQVSDFCIFNIGYSRLNIITNPPESEVIELLMGAVNESLPDLLKGNETLHTAETALVTVLSPLRMQGVTEVFSIIIGAV